MKAGDLITLYCGRQAANGLPAYSRQTGDFVVTENGAAIAFSGLTELGVPPNSAYDFYSLQVQDPGVAGNRLYQIEPGPTQYISDIISPNQWGGPLCANDDDSLAGLMLLQAGVPGVLTANNTLLGNIVDGNSYLSPSLTLPAGMLTPYGITSLTQSGVSVAGKINDAPGDSDTVLPVCTVVNGPAYQVQIGWVTQNFASLGAVGSKTWYIDVNVTYLSYVITAARYSFVQIWKR